MVMSKKVIKGIREYYHIADCYTDEEVAEKTAGSMGETIVRLKISLKEVLKWFQWKKSKK